MPMFSPVMRKFIQEQMQVLHDGSNQFQVSENLQDTWMSWLTMNESLELRLNNISQMIRGFENGRLRSCDQTIRERSAVFIVMQTMAEALQNDTTNEFKDLLFVNGDLSDAGRNLVYKFALDLVLETSVITNNMLVSVANNIVADIKRELTFAGREKLRELLISSEELEAIDDAVLEERIASFQRIQSNHFDALVASVPQPPAPQSASKQFNRRLDVLIDVHIGTLRGQELESDTKATWKKFLIKDLNVLDRYDFPGLRSAVDEDSRHFFNREFFENTNYKNDARYIEFSDKTQDIIVSQWMSDALVELQNNPFRNLFVDRIGQINDRGFYFILNVYYQIRDGKIEFGDFFKDPIGALIGVKNLTENAELYEILLNDSEKGQLNAAQKNEIIEPFKNILIKLKEDVDKKRNEKLEEQEEEIEVLESEDEADEWARVPGIFDPVIASRLKQHYIDHPDERSLPQMVINKINGIRNKDGDIVRLGMVEIDELNHELNRRGIQFRFKAQDNNEIFRNNVPFNLDTKSNTIKQIYLGLQQHSFVSYPFMIALTRSEQLPPNLSEDELKQLDALYAKALAKHASFDEFAAMVVGANIKGVTVDSLDLTEAKYEMINDQQLHYWLQGLFDPRKMPLGQSNPLQLNEASILRALKDKTLHAPQDEDIASPSRQRAKKMQKTGNIMERGRVRPSHDKTVLHMFNVELPRLHLQTDSRSVVMMRDTAKVYRDTYHTEHELLGRKIKSLAALMTEIVGEDYYQGMLRDKKYLKTKDTRFEHIKDKMRELYYPDVLKSETELRKAAESHFSAFNNIFKECRKQLERLQIEQAHLAERRNELHAIIICAEEHLKTLGKEVTKDARNIFIHDDEYHIYKVVPNSYDFDKELKEAQSKAKESADAFKSLSVTTGSDDVVMPEFTKRAEVGSATESYYFTRHQVEKEVHLGVFKQTLSTENDSRSVTLTLERRPSGATVRTDDEELSPADKQQLMAMAEKLLLATVVNFRECQPLKPIGISHGTTAQRKEMYLTLRAMGVAMDKIVCRNKEEWEVPDAIAAVREMAVRRKILDDSSSPNKINAKILEHAIGGTQPKHDHKYRDRFMKQGKVLEDEKGEKPSISYEPPKP